MKMRELLNFPIGYPYVLFLLLIFAIMLIWYNYKEKPLEFSENLKCKWEREMAKNEFSGKVIAKYLDENNHLYPTLVLESEPGQKKSIRIINELGGIYDKILVGDYISKRKNILIIKIKRDTSEFVQNFDFGCKK